MLPAKKHLPSLPTSLRIAIIIIWGLLFAGLLNRDYFVKSLDLKEADIVQRARQESFLGIYFKDQRIGYVKNKLTKKADGDGLLLRQEAFMRLNVLGQNHPIKMQVSAELSNSQLLRNFVFKLNSPFYEMAATGEVRGKTVLFTLSTGKEKINDKIKLSRPPFLSTNQRAYLLEQGLQAGDKIKIPYFDPISLSGKDTVMVYQGKEKILVNGRVFILHHFIENFSGIKISSWLDDTGKVIKEKSPAGFVFISEPEFAATDIVKKGKELLSSVSVPILGTLPDLKNRRQIRFRLSFPADTNFSLDKDRQSLKGDILTISREEMPAAGASVCPGPPATLAASPYIQVGNKKISG